MPGFPELFCDYGRIRTGELGFMTGEFQPMFTKFWKSVHEMTLKKNA